MSEADKVREALHDDASVSNQDFGRLVEEAAEADERRSWAAEADPPEETEEWTADPALQPQRILPPPPPGASAQSPADDEPPRYTWFGWDTGDDVTPPEPDKEWLTIADDGEEMAVIVHRLTGHPDSEKWRAQKIEAAKRIVDALNAFDRGQR